MIVNFLGPYTIVHPYADQGALSILTHDTRPTGSVSTVYDGLVYEEFTTTPRQALLGDFCMVLDDVLRTTVPLIGSRVFKCGHVWRDENKTREHDEDKRGDRLSTLKLQDGILVIQDIPKTDSASRARATGKPTEQIVTVDLSSKIELKNNDKTTLWDHLQSGPVIT
jgi:hypothetical protein